jgi:hypothetical protein
MEPKDTSHETAAEDRWNEHLMRAVDAFAREMRGVVPDDFSKHARGTLREALMAVRSLIDTGIDKLDDEEADERTRQPRKVEVE